MTQHTHTTVTPGCYRCELGQDEMSAIERERDQDWAEFREQAVGLLADKRHTITSDNGEKRACPYCATFYGAILDEVEPLVRMFL